MAKRCEEYIVCSGLGIKIVLGIKSVCFMLLDREKSVCAAS
jgi:hypothetical protein